MITATSSTTHAARMNAIYRYQRHIYDLTRKYYLLGRDRLIAELAVPTGGRVLEIGCGTGRNLIKAARRYPAAHFHGIDISPAMLAVAQRNIARAGLAGRITLVAADAAGFDAQALFGAASFDRVMLSYTLSMVPDWRAALAMAASVTAPGGALHIVDFGQQERLPRAFRALLHRWLARFEVTPVGQLPTELARLAGQHDRAWHFCPLWRGYAWHGVIR